MLRGWWMVLAVAAILSCTAAKPTTQDTLVVSRSDDESSTTASSEVTTEEPNAPIKLTEMDVQSKISLRYAHTAVVTRVRNPAKRAQETTFRMLLPDTAFISGFTMTIDGKAYKAYVKPKEEAKQIYSDAVSQGLGAAHIAAKARDSNHFTVSVNVEPSSSVVFNLTYEELLVRRNGVYNHAVNLHPGTVVPKMKVTVHIKEAEKITELRVPEIRTGNEVDATAEDPQNSKANIVRTHDDREAIITFTPDIEEQRQLMRVYAEKSKDSMTSSNRWYPEDNEEKKEKEGVLGQFVVQYDVDRSKSGEILVNDGYFVHFFAPASLPPLAKHVVFVLDTSGSMIGRKVEQLRDAMQTILAKLNPGDWFSIVEFNSYVKVHDLKEADEPAPSTPNRYYYGGGTSNEPPKLVAPSPATPENIAKAKIIISRLDAGGGTDIASALDVAVDLVHNGAAVDGDKQEQTGPKTDDATENKTTKDAVSKKLEPIIIFLTDGDPTIGVTDPTRIINRLSEKNSGDQKASIFSLAFGEDADRKFLRKLSLRNEGFMRHIYEAADAALQLRDFYRTVSSPLLADVKFLYPKAQIKEGSLTKNTFRTYYAGSETVVAGRIENEATEIQPQVLAFCGVEDGAGRKKYEISPKVPVVHMSVDYYPLERLWAYLTIKQLLDEKDALIESKNDTKETMKKLEQKALDIALNYEFVTPLTSLVVVKPNATKAVNAESVDESPANEGPTPVALTSAFSYSRRPSLNGFAPLTSAFSYSRGPSLNGFALSAKLGGVSRSDTKSYASNSFSYINSPTRLRSSLSAPQASLAYFARPSSYYTVQNIRFGTASKSTAQQQFLPYYDPASDINSAPMATHYGSMDFTALEEEDDTDTFSDRIVGGYSGIRGPPSSPFLALTTRRYRPTTMAPSSTTKEPSTTSNPLEAYSLKDFPWTLPLLDRASDALLLHVNGTQVTLKLAKDVDKSSLSSSECSKATDGAAGRCVYLTSCAAAQTITAAIYETTYCVLDAGYAGVCCPISKDSPPSS